MTTYRKRHEHWTETKRVVAGPDGEPAVKQVTCCCEAPAATAKQCQQVSGNKSRCRCFCHSRKVEAAR